MDWNVLNTDKIILTTDRDLIADDVQAIDDEFLEWFVKNPSCEEVKYVGDDCYREIIIPQKEPKQKTLKEVALELFPNKSFWIGSGKTSRLYDPNQLDRERWTQGAKWQAERMYSEEEVRKMFNRYNEIIAHRDIEEWQPWIEKQFKKK
jgi:hypothetical protein